MMTSIPYEPGWSIKVDGKRVDNLVEEVKNDDGSISLKNQSGDSGQIVVVDAMVGLRLPAGTHTVTMTYTPPGWWIGIALLAGGIVLLVVFWFGDRKRYAVMLAELAQQQERERQEAAKRAKMKSAKAAKESSPEALLEKLEALHKQGVLDDAEFEEKKAAILKKKPAENAGDPPKPSEKKDSDDGDTEDSLSLIHI